jgi:ferredoxin
MSRTRGFVNFLEKLFPYRFLGAKLTKIPPIRKLSDRMLFDKTNLTILPKDTVIKINKPIPPSDTIVLPSQVVEYFIRRSTYRFIMSFCICRDALHCVNYPATLGCLFLGEAARDIPPAFGRAATIEEALTHVQRCRAAGLVHLVGRDKIDETWLGIRQGEKLMTICNCCHCCCLWKMLPDLDPQISAKVRRMPGVVVSVTDGCTGCGWCVETCFVHAIHLTNGHAVIGDQCRGCGRCVDRCPRHAVRLTITDKRFGEHTIDRIESVVNVR